MAFLTLIALFIRSKLRHPKDIPEGLQNGVEAIIEIFDNFLRSTTSESLMYLGNWFFMVFAFILISNTSGLVGMRPPTADWATTCAFALATVIIIQVVGIRHRKGEYLRSFFEPHWLFFPLNLVNEISRPLSLSFRLFGNILAGMILISMLYALLPVALRFFLPVVLHAFFDIFYGAMQTYIFCVLSLTFINSAADIHE